jgi:hypothetical protein
MRRASRFIAWVLLMGVGGACGGRSSTAYDQDAGAPLDATAVDGQGVDTTLSDGGSLDGIPLDDSPGDTGGADATIDGSDASPSDAARDDGSETPDAADANAPDVGTSTWTLHYQGPINGSDNVQTTFTRVGAGADGVYSGDCYGVTDTATVTGNGTNYTETPMAGCFETQGNPCIECAVGKCPSGTTVTLSLVDAGVWQGACGLYTVTLSHAP